MKLQAWHFQFKNALRLLFFFAKICFIKEKILCYFCSQRICNFHHCVVHHISQSPKWRSLCKSFPNVTELKTRMPWRKPGRKYVSKKILRTSYSHSISIQTRSHELPLQLQFTDSMQFEKDQQKNCCGFWKPQVFWISVAGSPLLLNGSHVRRRLLTDVAINKNEINVDFIE